MSKNKKIITSLVAIVMVLSTLLTIAIPASAAAPADGYVENVTTGKYVTIKNVGSGKLLNVYGSKNKNNTNITVYQADGTTGQSFKFVKSGNAYVIVPKCATSRALNVYGSSAKNNSNVCLWSKTGHNTQAWIIDYNPSLNGFVIRSANNQNYVLAATGSKNSSNVCLKKYNPNDKYQVWTSSALSANTPKATTPEDAWLWPTTYKRISCGFADNVYHTSHWHRGIDIPVACGTDVYASKSGTVALVVGDTSSRGRYLIIDHGDGYYSEYQHLQSISVKKGDTVKQGDVIAKSGDTDGPNLNNRSAHLHFEIMYLGKSGLGSQYTNYWNSYSKYVNTNPQNTDKVFCTKSNSKSSGFKIGQKQGNNIPTANLEKTSTKAPYGVYCFDENGLNYIFK